MMNQIHFCDSHKGERHGNRHRKIVIRRESAKNQNFRQGQVPQPQLYGKDTAGGRGGTRQMSYLWNGVPIGLGEPHASPHTGAGVGY